jgi:hypothetical protein
MKFPLIGDPDKQPVKLLPAPAALVPVALFAVPPGTFWFGAAGEVWLGVSAAGAFEAGPVCDGSAVLGVDVCGLVPEGLCVCAGAGPEGDVLSGDVLWATTQLADSSNRESSVALDFIKV